MFDLGLQKYNIYKTFRPYQEETIKKIIDFVYNSPKRFLFIQAPTGSGKSIVGYVASQYLTKEASFLKKKIEEGRNNDSELEKHANSIKNIFMLTSKNLLLDQYYRDFNKYMPVLKGRAHYVCSLDKKPCSEGICLMKKAASEMSCYKSCPFQEAKFKFLNFPVSATNFSLLLKLLRREKFPTKDMVIVDECQAFESVLRDEYVVTVSGKTTEIVNGLKEEMRSCSGHEIVNRASVKYEENGGSFKKLNLEKVDPDCLVDINDFLKVLLKDEKALFNSLSSSLNEYVKEEYLEDIEGAIKKEKEIKEIVKKCDFLSKAIGNIENYFFLKDSVEWVSQAHFSVDGSVGGFEIKPVTIEKLTESLFQRLAKKKVIMMSATIGDPLRFAKSLGIKENNFEFIDIPSTFPIENRPFVKLPVCSMKYSEMEKNLPKIAEACDDILDMFPEQNGIIHSVSFKNAFYLKNHMRNSNRILIHDQKNKELILENFKNAKNKVLVSPSLIEGFDFKGKQSEFQIFIKVPYLSLSDKVVKRRLELDEEWYVNCAILQILQGVGRSVRSEKDVATTFCLDNNINFLLHKYKHLFTKDFLNTIVKVE